MPDKVTSQIAIKSAACALAILVIANFLICFSESRRNSKVEDGLASWWSAKAYFADTNPPDVVVLGSSQLGPLLGADAYVYNKSVDITGDHRSYVLEHDLRAFLDSQWRVFVSAIPGAMISDQLIICRSLFADNYKPKLVAITLSPRDFIDKDYSSLTSTEAFTFFSKYPKTVCLRNGLAEARKTRDEFTGSHNYASENKSSITLGEPFQRIHKGEIVICSGDGYSFENNIEEYQLRYRSPFSKQFDEQMAYLDSLLQYLWAQQIKVIVFDLPLTTKNRKLLPPNFWSLYNQRIRQICKKNNADWIFIDQDVPGFTDKEFVDGIHLNLVGGHRLASTLALYIANKFHWKSFAELQDNERNML